MAVRFALILLVGLVAQGYGQEIKEVILDDHTVNHIGNPFIGTTITIPKFMFDRLQSCHVIFPNGVIYEGYPTDNIPGPNVFFLSAVEPFVSCGIGFRGVTSGYSGTYELYSIVEGHSDLSLTLTRQKFHVNIVDSEVEFPSK